MCPDTSNRNNTLVLVVKGKFSKHCHQAKKRPQIRLNLQFSINIFCNKSPLNRLFIDCDIISNHYRNNNKKASTSSLQTTQQKNRGYSKILCFSSTRVTTTWEIFKGSPAWFILSHHSSTPFHGSKVKMSSSCNFQMFVAQLTTSNIHFLPQQG